MKKLEPAPVSTDIVSGQRMNQFWEKWLSAFRNFVNDGVPHLSECSEYANNAAALAAGLDVGDLYRTGDALKIVH